MDKEEHIFQFPDESIWHFSEEFLKSELGNDYVQVQAVDVTQLYEKRDELYRKNAELSDAIKRSKQLYKDLEKIIRQEEIISMKMKVHDDFGTGLIAARRSLEQDQTLKEIKKNGLLWEHAVACLGNAAKEWNTAISMEAIERKAKELRATLIEENVPPEAMNDELFLAATKECVSNCARHAGGDELYIKFTELRINIPTSIFNQIIHTDNAIKIQALKKFI